MRRSWRRWLAGIMTAVMLVCLMPTAVYAAVGELVRNSAVENAALLAALKDAYGEDAETYYALLRAYGLLDENGELVTDEKVVVDGEAYTLEELEEYLADPDTDLTQVATVDGTPITLEELALVLEIERYLAYVQTTYFTPQDLTDEQVASFYDLADAWANGQVRFSAMRSATSVSDVGPHSGVNHGVETSMTLAKSAYNYPTDRAGEFTLTITTTGQPQEGHPVEVSLRVLPGTGLTDQNITVSFDTSVQWSKDGDSYRLTIAEAGNTTMTIHAEVPTSRVLGVLGEDSGEATFLVELYDLENSTFEGGKRYLQAKGSFEVGRNDVYYQRDIPVTIPAKDAVVSYWDFGGTSLTANGLNVSVSGILNNDMAQQITAEVGEISSMEIDTSKYDLAEDSEGYFYEISANSFTLARPDQTIKIPNNDNQPFWGSEGDYDAESQWWTTSDVKNSGTINPTVSLFATIGGEPLTSDATSTTTKEIEFTLYNTQTVKVSDPILALSDAPKGETLKVGVQSTISYHLLEGTKNSGDWAQSKSAGLLFRPALPNAVTATVKATGRTDTVKATVSAPAGTYYPGQMIPVTVDFDYPVRYGDVNLMVNDQPLERYANGQNVYINRGTWFYKVPDEVPPTLTLTSISGTGTDDGKVTGANGGKLTLNADIAGEETEGIFPNVKLSVDPADAFQISETDFAVTTNEDGASKLAITVPVDRSQSAYIDLVTNGLTLKAAVQRPNGQIETVTLEPVEEQTSQGSTTGAVITKVAGEVELGESFDADGFTGLVEFYLVSKDADEELLVGKMYEYTIVAPTPVAAENLSTTLTATSGNQLTTYTPENATVDAPAVVYAQTAPTLSLDFALKGMGFTWGNTARVGYYGADGKLYQAGGAPAESDSGLHFAWKSSNPTVAGVTVDTDKKATLTLTGTAGKAALTLVAFNGGPDGEGDDAVVGMKDAESTPIHLEVRVGQDPFLLIPEGQVVSIRQGSDAVVNWSSNLCAKDPDITFHVNVYKGALDGKDPSTENLVREMDLTASPEAPISSATLRWEDLLERLYNDDNVRSLTVTVSARYDEQDYGTYSYEQDGKTVWVHGATATVSMVSQPAAIALHEPSAGLYQTDSGGKKTIELTWDLNHLEDDERGGQFELYVASSNPGFGVNGTLTVTDLGIANDGSYSLTIPAVELKEGDPTSYRDTYTVTVKAKNAAESTWAYSSYVLYVYSQNALEILVDGASKGSVTMSNEEWIRDLWGENGSAAIVALQRDIALKNVVSINYGDYAWAELSDQIQWESSDSSVASLNYKQGGLYENIENFSYTSYRPASDFVLSGLSEGSTTITATHARAGISDSLDVTVRTLRDKLYLFQCYPIGTVTTLTYEEYTDAGHSGTVRKTVQTNEQGEAAIYAPYGIAGDVYCQSETKDTDGSSITWMGTIYHNDLTSSEADSTKLQLYPVNTLQLRRAAQVDLYLKTPEGTPYSGLITFRGGVYREGEYCIGNGTEADSGVRFTLWAGDREQIKQQPGYEDQTVTVGDDGHLRVVMDITQFRTAGNKSAVEAGERIHYLFQLEVPETGGKYPYYPSLLRVDATLNTKDVLASGDSIITLDANEDPARQGPYIASQTLQYNNSPAASQTSVRKSTGNVGPSTTFPNAWVTTSVMWWGEKSDTGDLNTITLQDSTGKVLPGQVSQRVTYPFLDEAFSENVLTLNERNMAQWGLACYQARNIDLNLSRNGTDVDMKLRLPFRIVNMIGAQKLEDTSVLGDAVKEIQSAGDVDANKASGANASLSGTDFLIQKGMALVAGDSAYNTDQDIFAIRLVATSDPTVFRAFFCVNVGNMSSGGNVTGIYPDYGDTENMVFADAGQEADFDKFPNAMNIYQMAKGTYMQSVKDEAKQAASGKGTRSFNFDLGGYFEADIYYDTEAGSWATRPISGGFHAGGGLNYTWSANAWVGPVPVTTSLTLGGSLEIRLDVQRGTYYTVQGDPTALSEVVSQTKAEASKPLAEGETAQEREERAQQAFDGTLNGLSYLTKSDIDYLTTLRIYLYIRVFAGLGFDVSVLAFKIGVFGQLGVDLNFRWLNRSYLDDPANFSAVGPVASRQESVMDGQKPVFSGATGIEFVFKFLFISYEKVLCSVGFQVEGKYGEWDAIEEIWAENKTINNRPVTRMLMPNGQAMYAIDLGAQMESRDYVDLEEQFWVPPVNALDLDEDSPLPEVLQTGAYPYANPVLSDDGKLLLYLSDRKNESNTEAAKDVTNTRAAVSKLTEGVYLPGTRLEAGSSPAVNTNDVQDGYGDSALRVAGDEDFAAAVWVRQMSDITPEDTAGDGSGELTGGQQMLQFNSTEIVAGIYDGIKWMLHQLTSNSAPDLAPVVTTNGDRTIVAWREVNSTSVDNITDFDQQDSIRYAIYDKKSGWQTKENGAIDVQTLYNGSDTAGTVKGIEAAMLEDGTAVVVYTLDTGEKKDNTDWEIMAAIIPNRAATQAQSPDGVDEVRSEDTIRTFQLTKSGELDENPQVTAVYFDEKQEDQRFVIAWHTERQVTSDGGTESDIGLAVLDKNGALSSAMPDSLGRSVEGTGDTVGSNFRFAKNADSMEDLTILWVDSVEPDEVDDTSYTDGNLDNAVSSAYTSYMGYDVLKAVKFVPMDGSFTVSGAVEVATMQTKEDGRTKYWTIDSFDARMERGEVKSVILGTNYDASSKKQVEISGGDGSSTTATIEVPSPVSRMFTATEPFQNQIELSAVALAYDELYPNSKIDVQFTIRNSGIAPMTGLTITADGEGDPTYQDNKLNVAPNRDVTVTAQFPTGDEIKNTAYTITAIFGDDKVTYEDTLYLDIPDVGVSKLEVVEEQGGERVLRYALHNILSAKLADAGDNWRVKVGFYADQSCTKPLGVTGSDYLAEDNVIIIQDPEDLQLIDAGGFSDQVTFDVAAYVGEGQEIPEVGIPIYIKAWVEQGVTADPAGQTQSLRRANSSMEYFTVTEYFEGNNITSRLIDNLAERRNETVTIRATLDNSQATSSVTVDVLYNRLTGTTTGNLIVTLLDENGQPIEKLQSFSQNNDLIELEKEGKAQKVFHFTKKGASVQVAFSELILGQGSTELDHISLSGAEVVYDEDLGLYTATGTGLTSGILEIAPKDPQYATITLNGQAYDVSKSQTVSLPYGTTEWTITVTNGGTPSTYTLRVVNTNPATSSSGGSTYYTVTAPEHTEHGDVTVSPKRASAGQTVTITARPDEGYQVGTVTVTRADGDTVAVTNRGDGVYTFTMPRGQVTVDVTFVPEGEWRNPFHDVASDAWYYDAVRYVNERGLMAGTSGDRFSPGTALTRAMVVQILWAMEGKPQVNYLMQYGDVPADAWYTEAVRWAASEGIVTGYSDHAFGPDDPVTRQQLALILYNYARSKGYDTNYDPLALAGFTDGAEMADWAGTGLGWAVDKGLLSGVADGILNPTGQATRAQVAQILMKFCEGIAK